MVATLGALHAIYVPLEVQEALPDKSTKVNLLGIWTSASDDAERLIEVVSALEAGRALCRDIGGSDPERMTPPRVYDYVNKMFINSNVKVSVITDPAIFEKDFPCLAAVNRCANVVSRHRGHLIELEYVGDGPTSNTLFLIGKGITYDTGGADIKAGGGMAGMHRDKCGAAAVAGFFKVLYEARCSSNHHIPLIFVFSLVHTSILLFRFKSFDYNVFFYYFSKKKILKLSF
uniref:Cytosol aminopeptidase domain-containing protein n=1 Tax=Eptatretus burgeri TaxID=7764 RepID=A0A8C4Q7X0_EPTBU